jgi:phosphoglycolate phosphatase-like HAD superfamily hydrolase
MSNLKLVIFDFDGTIADTMALGLGIANLLAKKFLWLLFVGALIPNKL